MSMNVASASLSTRLSHSLKRRDIHYGWVVVGLGTGATALVVGATVATRWFHKRRGLVVGMLTASNATGQLVFLPVLASLSDAYGWRVALAMVLVVLSAALLLVFVLMHNY